MDNPLFLTTLVLGLIALLFAIASVNSKKVPQKQKAKIFSKLEELRDQVESPEVYARRDAVIRLDNLLSKALQVRYRNDKSCGDNLKMAKNLFNKNTYQEIWDAHKLRNEIVHKDQDVTEDQARDAFKIYKLSINKILG